MWLLTTKGTLSIVARDPKRIEAGSDLELVIRARRKEWIDAFRAEWCPELGETICSGPGHDYQWRAYVSRHDLALALARFAVAGAQYGNFKSATASARYGLKNAKLRHSLHDAYSSVWSTMLSAGDGTSAYDGGWGASDAGTIDICARLGHWFATGAAECSDCDTPRPNGLAGPQGGKPTQAEVDAWWKSRGGRKPKIPARAKKATAAAKKTAAKNTATTGGRCITWTTCWPSCGLATRCCTRTGTAG